MRRSSILICLMLAAASGGAPAQESKQPERGVSAGAAGQGQTEVQADPGGASARGGAAGSASAETGGSQASLAQGTEIEATLSRSVDAGKVRPGDEVTARTTKDAKSEGGVVVPRGSKLLGRVTRAEPHRKGDEAGGTSASQLGIVFDRAVLRDGSEVVLNGSVAAIGAAQSAGGGSASGASRINGSAGTSGAGLAGAVGGAVGGATRTAGGAAAGVGTAVGGTAAVAARSAGAIGGFDAAGGLKSGSRGVFGLRDLDIQTAAAGTAEGSVVSSAQRNVRLESGTQMLLVAGGSAGPKPAAATPGQPAKEPVDRR